MYFHCLNVCLMFLGYTQSIGTTVILGLGTSLIRM